MFGSVAPLLKKRLKDFIRLHKWLAQEKWVPLPSGYGPYGGRGWKLRELTEILKD